MREAAGGPAGFGVEEADAPQRAADARLLLSPVAAAVVGLPDGAAVADRPAAPRIDEADVVQPGVVAQGLGGRGIERLCGAIAGAVGECALPLRVAAAWAASRSMRKTSLPCSANGSGSAAAARIAIDKANREKAAKGATWDQWCSEGSASPRIVWPGRERVQRQY